MENSENKVVIYETEDQVSKVEVRMEGETVWLTNLQLSQVFKVTKSTISEHIKNIYNSGELNAEATVRKFRTVQVEGTRQVTREIEHYNLDMIISLGYRVNSKVATRFRQWATTRLNEYIRKGFTLDDDRLKGEGGGNYWKELLDRIRDIRSSEKALYRQVLDLYATISSTGDIKICPMDNLPNIGNPFGNVFESSLKQIYDKDAEFVSSFISLTPPSLFSEGCSNCDQAVFCHTCVARGLISAQQNAGKCEWYNETVSPIIKAKLGLS